MATKPSRIGTKEPIRKYQNFLMPPFQRKSKEPKENFIAIFLSRGDQILELIMELVMRCLLCISAGPSSGWDSVTYHNSSSLFVACFIGT